MSGTDPWTLAMLAGLTLVTIVTRSFFFISERPLPRPGWLDRGLRYAPVAALAAVIVPELLMVQGQLVAPWTDARLYGALAGLAWYAWRRGVLGTILVGMLIYLPLHLLAGW